MTKIKQATAILDELGYEYDQLNAGALVVSGISDDQAEELFTNNDVLRQLQWFLTDTGEHLLIELGW
jgi:hypothetical protein